MALEQLPAIHFTQQSYLRATDFDTYSLDAQQLRAALTGAVGGQIALPNPDGDLDWFTVEESSVMAPELAALFPEIRTFQGQGIDDPAATVRFDITPAGFHAQVLSPNGSFYIDPYYHLEDSFYAVYAAENTYLVPDFMECILETDCGCSDSDHSEKDLELEPIAAASELASSFPAVQEKAAQTELARSGEFLRTYRIAVAATGEYTAFHGGTVALGQAAIVTAINRVSGIYETELSIRLQLVGNNSQLVYTNASTDPYTNNNASSLLTQNQANIDSVIGNANYDVGHVFSTAGGGLAGLGVVGITGQKARGETGLSSPTGDSFYVDYVAHELGHQFGANHTFNGDSGSCSGTNRNASTAYEPGSGTTIMAYAGICGNDDLQAHSDPYFHSASFDEIIAYVDNSIPTVGTRTATGNSVPTVNAGSNFTIPAQTPFILTASGSDADVGDVLTYNWEQRDLGPQRDVSATDNGSSPLFRSFLPTTSPSRTFTRLPELLNNTTVIGEKLPTLSRTMDFRVTVRDNRVGGGGVNSDDMIVNVVNTGAAFAVTSPNTAVNWAAQSTQTVTWNVAGTTTNGINTSLVNILLSTDGGNTFTTVLAASTPNDGSQAIVVPNLASTTARIKVEAVANIFFDISNANFTVSGVIPGIDLYGTTFAVDPINLQSAGGFVDTNFSVANQGDTAASTFDVKFYLSDDATIDPGSDILLTLDPGDVHYDASEPSAYHVSGGLASAGTHSSTIRLAVPTNDPFATDNQYFLGMVVDADANVSETDETNNRNRGQGLDRQNVFYSTGFSNPTSISIPDSGAANPYPSNITVSGLAGTVADVNVSLFGLTHTFPDDLDILLVGPAGQKMILMSDVGGGSDVVGVNLTFDDSAANSLPNNSQLTSGTFKPSNSGGGGVDTFSSPAPSGPYDSLLSVFQGMNPNGVWSLYVLDDDGADIGSFSGGWALTFTLNNTAPTNPTNVALPAIDEDTTEGSNPGRVISSIVSASGSTDADGNPLGIAVTSVDNANGQWQYSTNGGGSWQAILAASLTSARLLGPSHYVRFVPGADFNSDFAVSPTFGFKVWDQTTGAAGATANTTTGTSFSAATAQASQPVSAVNDAPSFALAGPLVATVEDFGPVSVPGFATDFAPGPATATDEAAQALVFLATVIGVTGTLSFNVAPSIDPATGELSFAAAVDSNGTAMIEVVLQDNGNGTPPNVNESSSQQFIIEVTAVNDEQVLAVNAGLTVDQDSAATITTAILETTDVDDSVADLLYTIITGPSHGAILVNGNPATQFSQQDINDGLVSYEHDGSTNFSDQFEFNVDDGEGEVSPGIFSISIQASAPILLGDYNRDEIVNAADYVLWRKNNGTPSDYDAWRANFGASVPAGSSSYTDTDGGAGAAARKQQDNTGTTILDEPDVATTPSGSGNLTAALSPVSNTSEWEADGALTHNSESSITVVAPSVVVSLVASENTDKANNIVLYMLETQPESTPLTQTNELTRMVAEVSADVFASMGSSSTVAQYYGRDRTAFIASNPTVAAYDRALLETLQMLHPTRRRTSGESRSPLVAEEEDEPRDDLVRAFDAIFSDDSSLTRHKRPAWTVRNAKARA